MFDNVQAKKQAETTLNLAINNNSSANTLTVQCKTSPERSAVLNLSELSSEQVTAALEEFNDGYEITDLNLTQLAMTTMSYDAIHNAHDERNIKTLFFYDEGNFLISDNLIDFCNLSDDKQRLLYAYMIAAEKGFDDISVSDHIVTAEEWLYRAVDISDCNGKDDFTYDYVKRHIPNYEQLPCAIQNLIGENIDRLFSKLVYQPLTDDYADDDREYIGVEVDGQIYLFYRLINS